MGLEAKQNTGSDKDFYFDGVADKILNGESPDNESPESSQGEESAENQSGSGEGQDEELTGQAQSKNADSESGKETESGKDENADSNKVIEEKLAKIKELVGDDEELLNAYIKKEGFHKHPAWQKLLDKSKKPSGELPEDLKTKIDQFERVANSPTFIRAAMKEQGYTEDAINAKLKSLGHEVVEKELDDFSIVANTLNLPIDNMNPEQKAWISDIAKISRVMVNDIINKEFPKRLKPIEENLISSKVKTEVADMFTKMKSVVQKDNILDFKKDIEPALHAYLDENPKATLNDVYDHFKDLNYSLSIERLKQGKKQLDRNETKKVLGKQLVKTTGKMGELPKKSGHFSEDADSFLNISVCQIDLHYLRKGGEVMATNVSYASGDTILESLVIHTLPDFSKEHGNGIIEQNFLLSKLKEKDRFNVVDGGLEFWRGVLVNKSTNSKWQGKSDQINTNEQDPSARLRWDIKTFTDSVIINKLDEARNKGKAMMKDFARTLREQAESTIPNDFNSAFWASSPGSNDPDSIPNMISITPTVGTIGGQTRSAKRAYQNKAYTTAVSDIGSEAGLSILKRMIIQTAINKTDKVDLVIMADVLYAGLTSYLETERRYMAGDRNATAFFESIKLGTCEVSYESTDVDASYNTINSKYVYGINSRHFGFDVLKDGNFMWNPDGFERVGQTLNKALYFWVFCNLTTNLPKAHFVMSDVSTT